MNFNQNQSILNNFFIKYVDSTIGKPVQKIEIINRKSFMLYSKLTHRDIYRAAKSH